MEKPRTTTKNRYRRAFPVLLTISLAFAGCATQTRVLTSGSGNALSSPRFGFFIANYPSTNSDSTEGDFFARIRYDDLIFIKSDSSYTAHYQLSINLYADKEMTESRYSRTFDRQIAVSKYSQTLSSRLDDVLKDKMVVKPGKYSLVLRLLDLNTNVTSSKEIDYDFKDFFHDSISVSDVVLYDRSDTSGVPVDVVRSNAGNYANFYVTSKNVPAKILLHLIAKSTESPASIDTVDVLDQTSTVQQYRLPVNVGNLAEAVYDLRITAGENSAETSFRIMRNMSNHVIARFDSETGPLAYITTAEEFDILRDASGEQRVKKSKEFWLSRSRGDTIVAEAMEKEFYRRVEYSDEQLGTALMPGWETDRGRIYILYGKPDRIENHPGNLGVGPASNSAPYEVWYYNSLKLRFVFVDEFKNGDYRLAKSGGT